MRLEIFILAITAFFVYNAYKDGKYIKMLLSFKKYYKMIFYTLCGLGIYILLKRNPAKGKELLANANNVLKSYPIDKNSTDLLSPILDFTTNQFNNSENNINNPSLLENFYGLPSLKNENQTSGFCSERKILSSGKQGTKRSVSETKKKYVASNQDWKCGNCNNQLDHTFEIDHKIRLEYGGGNDVNNLIALCRNCHGIKTASENM
jgi:hypothetical protein